MDCIKIKRLRPGVKLPRRANRYATGYDLFACIDSVTSLPVLVVPGLMTVVVGTGIAIEVPSGYDVQIRPRSGLSSRGAMVAFGTVDCDYRGELMVTICNLGDELIIRDGDRIAQMVISKAADLPAVEVDELTPTERGSKGHGSTGR